MRVLCLCLIILVLSSPGCRPENELTTGTALDNSGSLVSEVGQLAEKYWGPPPAEAGANSMENLYTSDYERYPGFGIVLFRVASWDNDSQNETKSILRSISLCRDAYSKSIRAGTAYEYDDFSSRRNDWLPGRDQFVRFAPRWIAVVVVERDVNATVPSRYPVGYVFDASSVFDEALLPESVLLGGFRHAPPVHEDALASYPSYRLVYDVIEKFRRKDADAFARQFMRD